MSRTFIVSAVFMVLIVLAVQKLETVGQEPAKAALVKANPPAARAPAPSYSRSMVIKARFGGQFEVDAYVEGRRVVMVVDTGASQIALRASDAARAAFYPTARDFTIKVATAN